MILIEFKIKSNFILHLDNAGNSSVEQNVERVQYCEK